MWLLAWLLAFYVRPGRTIIFSLLIFTLMPVPPELILAGGQLASGGLGIAANSAQNRNSRLWSELMYEKQKQDSLAFFNLQNEYNSPKAQMARLKEAGLNPMLVYGGSPGGAAGSADRVPTPDVQSPQFRTPDTQFVGDAARGLVSYLDYEIKQAQIDNLHADNTVKLEEAALKSAQRVNTEQGTSRSRFDLELDQELREVSADARREALRKLKADTDMSLSENERRAATTSQSLKEGAERILNMRLSRAHTRSEMARISAAIRNTDLDSKLKELDIELRRAGITSSDPIWARILGRILSEYSLKDIDLFKMPDLSTGGKSFRRDSSSIFKPGHHIKW